MLKIKIEYKAMYVYYARLFTEDVEILSPTRVNRIKTRFF